VERQILSARPLGGPASGGGRGCEANLVRQNLQRQGSRRPGELGLVCILFRSSELAVTTDPFELPRRDPVARRRRRVSKNKGLRGLAKASGEIYTVGTRLSISRNEQRQGAAEGPSRADRLRAVSVTRAATRRHRNDGFISEGRLGNAIAPLLTTPLEKLSSFLSAL
jgi:hypothetical protein